MIYEYTLKETRYHATIIKLSQNGGEIMEIVCLDLEGVLVPEIMDRICRRNRYPGIKKNNKR